MNNRNIKVFVSYSSIDASLAKRLANDLRTHGFEVWLDQWNLIVGTEFGPEIERGVDDADFLIVLLTSNSVTSDWVEREWRRKQQVENDTGRISVIPVRGEPCEIPDFLRQRSYADISGGSYPLGFQYLLDLLDHFAPAAGLSSEGDRPSRQPERWVPINLVTPIALEVARDLIALFEGDDTSRAMGELIPGMRAHIEDDLGFQVPGVRVRGNETDMPLGTALIMIDEVPITMLTVPDEVDRADYLIGALESEVRAAAAGFLGPDGARHIIQAAGPAAVELAAPLIPAVVSWFELTDVLRRLVEEDVHIGDIERILRALAERSSTDDAAALAELARHALRDRITAMLTDDRGIVTVCGLGPRAEARLTNSVQTTSSGSYLALDPAETQSILAGVRTTLGDNPDDGRARDQRRVTRVALLTSVAARRYLRKLIELEFPTVRVISPEDLDPAATIRRLGTIELAPTT
ncbi:MAG: FHIPEP family type III secretion protein [Acidimicrobiia bacterium]|nr:FHIPEP family type III secretion protein [Acidimicrobiia bacterium]